MFTDLSAFATQLETRAPRTAATYLAIIGRFLAARPSDSSAPVDRAYVDAFLGRRRADGACRSAATRNQELAAFRAFSSYLEGSGECPLPLAGLRFQKEPVQDPAVLTAPELRRLFVVAAEEPDATRRAMVLAIVALLTQNGLRVHELVRLDVDQLDLATSSIISVRGKGDSVHDLPMNEPTARLVEAWLAHRSSLAAGERALFVSRRGTRASSRWVQRLFVRLRTAMGTPKKVTPHTGRHSTATLCLSTGSDISTTADVLRHVDLNVTRRYLHLVDERKREAVRRLAVAVPLEVLPQATSPRTEAVRPPRPPLDGQHLLDDAA